MIIADNFTISRNNIYSNKITYTGIFQTNVENILAANETTNITYQTNTFSNSNYSYNAGVITIKKPGFYSVNSSAWIFNNTTAALNVAMYGTLNDVTIPGLLVNRFDGTSEANDNVSLTNSTIFEVIQANSTLEIMVTNGIAPSGPVTLAAAGGTILTINSL